MSRSDRTISGGLEIHSNTPLKMTGRSATGRWCDLTVGSKPTATIRMSLCDKTPRLQSEGRSATKRSNSPNRDLIFGTKYRAPDDCLRIFRGVLFRVLRNMELGSSPRSGVMSVAVGF